MKNFIENKKYREPSVFTPENLLREARRQKRIDHCRIPDVCILDPDGDLVEYLLRTRQAELDTCWACYHTKLYRFRYKEFEFGVVGCAVGSSFAVLVAEELFASGCQLLISVTSAGIIHPPENNSRFILIARTIRDEGTSYHYLPPEEDASIHESLLDILIDAYKASPLSIESGTSWTTDAPFRETLSAIEFAKNNGAVCVEMEAAALYAFAQARNNKVICFAHLTNTMAQRDGDFEKGEEMGSTDTLELIYYTIRALSETIQSPFLPASRKNHWETIYSTKKPHEVSWTQEKPQTSLDLAHSFNFPENASIIDIGGGDSKLVDCLLEEGYQDITVLDISEQALKRAKERLGEKAGKVKWVVSDVTEFHPERSYDWWHDRAAFHFLTTEEQIGRYLETARRAIKNRGFLTIGTFSTNGPKKCSGLEIKQYSEESLGQLLEKGFEKIRCITEDHTTPFNTTQNFLFCSFRRVNS